jgi:flagellar biosynthesis/type III secretory pathway protein FliH
LRLKALMQQHDYTYQSDFAKKYMAEGFKEGTKKGYREVLRKLLQQRFGELPADVMARLEEADADTLDALADRVLTAASLADVFASEPG